MITFAPEITVVIGSVTAICCSIICLILFYYINRQSKRMNKNTEKLTTAFTKLTNALMGETEDEDDKEANEPILIGSDTSFTNDVLDRMRNTRTPRTEQDDNKGKGDREVSGLHSTNNNPSPISSLDM